ncbi:hypothetical protein [Shimia ponticola]|uniref:hypothetical protein n=1 Tax=Shimia ponticola TaxID=2582893 RepID=UPI0011BE1D2C|nr:hypothetical protein [Shimia ponticola]
MRHALVWLLTTFLFAGTLYAEGLSLDDLEARASKAPDEMSRLRDILSNPDPDAALRALSIVMEEGSLEQQRIALEVGVTSTNPAIRRTAIEAYLNTKPAVTFSFDGSALGTSTFSWFKQYFQRTGSMTAEKIGQYTYSVGDYLEQNKCWSWANWPESCMFTITDENVTFFLRGVPGPAVLHPDGVVKGSVTVPNAGSVPFSFKVSL